MAGKIAFTWLDIMVAGILMASCAGAWWLARAAVDFEMRPFAPLEARFQARAGVPRGRIEVKRIEDELTALRAKLIQTRLETTALEASEAARAAVAKARMGKLSNEAVEKAKLATSRKLTEMLSPSLPRLEALWAARSLTLAESERAAADAFARETQRFGWEKRVVTAAVAALLVIGFFLLARAGFAVAGIFTGLRPQWNLVTAILVPGALLWFGFEAAGVVGIAIVAVFFSFLVLWTLRVVPGRAHGA